MTIVFDTVFTGENEVTYLLRSTKEETTDNPFVKYKTAAYVKEKLSGSEPQENDKDVGSFEIQGPGLVEAVAAAQAIEEPGADAAALANAEVEFRRALAIEEAADEPDLKNTGIAHWNLAGVLEKKGQLDEAEVEFRHALAIVKKDDEDDEDDEDPKATGETMKSLARVLEKKGQLDDAEEMYRRAQATGVVPLCEPDLDNRNTMYMLIGIDENHQGIKLSKQLIHETCKLIEKTTTPEQYMNILQYQKIFIDDDVSPNREVWRREPPHGRLSHLRTTFWDNIGMEPLPLPMQLGFCKGREGNGYHKSINYSRLCEWADRAYTKRKRRGGRRGKKTTRKPKRKSNNMGNGKTRHKRKTKRYKSRIIRRKALKHKTRGKKIHKRRNMTRRRKNGRT